MKKSIFIIGLTVTAAISTSCGGQRQNPIAPGAATVAANENNSLQSFVTTKNSLADNTILTASNQETPLKAVSINTTAVSNDDIRSGYFKIDGELYHLPMNYQDFAAKGWIFAEPDQANLLFSPGEEQALTLTKNGGEVTVIISNDRDEKMALKDLSITVLQMNSVFIRNSGIQVELPQGILLADAGIETLIAHYGQPDIQSTGGPSSEIISHYAYTVSEHSEFLFFTDGQPQSMYIQALSIESKDSFYQKERELVLAAAIDPATIIPTPEVAAYQLPADLGTDIASGIIKFEGDLYQFPIPLLALEKNGWVLRDAFPEELKPGEQGSAFLLRGDTPSGATVWNLGSETTSLHNCFITRIDMSNKLAIAPDIECGSSRQQVIQAIGSRDYRLANTEFSNAPDQYIVPLNNSQQVVIIYVSKDTDLVEAITIGHPRNYYFD